MLIVYDRTTRKIIGHCSRVFDSGKWREATMEEIFPHHDKTNLAAAYFTDDARYMMYGPENWRLRQDESGVVVGIERLPAIRLSTDASDHDADGIPDLPADGTSTTRITATTGDGTDANITFRTTRGSLSQRTIHTSEGMATVELRAANETVMVTVTATAPGYRPANLHLEFIPGMTGGEQVPTAPAEPALQRRQRPTK